MYPWSITLYRKSPLSFSLIWIGIYCLANSLAGPMSAAALAVNIGLSAVLFLWIKKQGLLKFYGLCKPTMPASRFLWYIPLLLFVSSNLWGGFADELSALDVLCHIFNMLCVGFLEEVIFRGLLFRAMAKDNVRSAIIVSSVTFGIGHILNLFNGSGMELVANLCQVVGAIVCGFLFVVLFYRGGSLVPCIIAHGVNNAVTIFGRQTKYDILITAITLVIAGIYTLILLRTLPKPTENTTTESPI